MNRATLYYRSHAKDRSALKMRLRDLAMSRVRFGYLRLTVMLKREGWAVGKKLVYRLYRELGLQMRTKKRNKLASELVDSGEGRPCAGYRDRQARLSRIDHRGQRQRVLQPRDGCVGLPSRREAGLHSARQAGGERIYGELQWPTAGRMLEHRVVLVSRGRPR